MKRVLFLCIGNSCRSPMAEGFARTYGSDVIEAVSAGLAPAPIIQPLTRKVMAEKNIALDEQFSKDLSHVELATIDLVVNISGRPLPATIPVEVRNWEVSDPIGREEEEYVRVRDEIERLVMNLILELRRQTRPRKRMPSMRRVIDSLSGEARPAK